MITRRKLLAVAGGAIASAFPKLTGAAQNRGLTMPTLNPIIMFQDNASHLFSNSAAELAVLDFPVVPGMLPSDGTNRKLRFRMRGRYRQNTNPTQNLTLRFKAVQPSTSTYTLWAITFQCAQNLLFYPFEIDQALFLPPSSAFVMYGDLMITPAGTLPFGGAVPSTGTGGASVPYMMRGTAGLDPAAVFNWQITQQWDIADLGCATIVEEASITLE